MEVIYQLLLLVPTLVEMIDDKDGDDHDGFRDFFSRAVIMSFCVGIVTVVKCYDLQGYHSDWFWPTLLKAFALSFCYFSALFQYLVNIAQLKVTEAKWYDHLNKISPPDKWKWYHSMNWRLRMALHFSILIVGLIIYFS